MFRWQFAALAATLVLLAAGCVVEPPAPEPTPTGAPSGALPTATGAAPPTAMPTLSQPSTGGKPSPNLPATLAPPPDQALFPPKEAHRSFPAPPDRDLFQLAAELKIGGQPNLPRVAREQPLPRAQGDVETFWLVDFGDLKVFQRELELRLITPNAYWWVERGKPIQQRALERAAEAYETSIYPRVTGAVGHEWRPGVDADPRLHILHADLRGVGGYFSAADEYPEAVFPFSNQREAIYLNTGYLSVNSEEYLATLAHELQHAVHWNADATEETWVNEGLSEVAAITAGYQAGHVNAFLLQPATSLTRWPLDAMTANASYGAATRFMQYLTAHYGSRDDLRPLLLEPADGVAGVDAYLLSRGHSAAFREVFRDWTIANLLVEPQGKYGFGEAAEPINGRRVRNGFGQFGAAIPQYAAEYIELSGLRGPTRLRFEGQPETPLLPADVGPEGCWWGNAGDAINATLTRSLDRLGAPETTLEYEIWHNLEENWDYAYLDVSFDNGWSWQIVETPHTSPENPVGNSFGPGYTGASGGWIKESVKLPYGQRPLLVRFQHVTDEAVHGPGLCLRNLRVPELGIAGNAGWEANGFVLTNNRVSQDYIVQLVETNGDNRVVREMSLDARNHGELVIADPRAWDRLVLVVAALAPGTQEPAPYRLIAEAVE